MSHPSPEVVKQVRNTDSRQCGIVLKPRPDRTNNIVVCFIGLPRLHDRTNVEQRSSRRRANIKQTSSRPYRTPPPGSNVGLGLVHSWSRVIANIEQTSCKRRAISACILNTFARRLPDRVNGVLWRATPAGCCKNSTSASWVRFNL